MQEAKARAIITHPDFEVTGVKEEWMTRVTLLKVQADHSEYI